MPPEALSRTDGGPGRPQGLLCSPVRLTRSPAESSFLISRPAGSRGATAGAAGVGPPGAALFGLPAGSTAGEGAHPRKGRARLTALYRHLPAAVPEASLG